MQLRPEFFFLGKCQPCGRSPHCPTAWSIQADKGQSYMDRTDEAASETLIHPITLKINITVDALEYIGTRSVASWLVFVVYYYGSSHVSVVVGFPSNTESLGALCSSSSASAAVFVVER